MFQNRLMFGLTACLALGAASALADDPMYKPGEVIEYRVGTAVPEKWERGVIVQAFDGGKQYIIREKPSQFFPEGPEKTHYPANLRRPGAAPPQVGPGTVPNVVGPNTVLNVGGADRAQGLLSEEDVLAYCRKVFGGADKEVNQVNLKGQEYHVQIRDYIKKHGTNFKAFENDKFTRDLHAQGTYAINIIHAVDNNYSHHPKLEDYPGTYWLRTSNRGSNSVKPDETGVKRIVIEDAQNESGRLTINRDGTYEWELLRGDAPSKWIRGNWRVAKPEEMLETEGGPAIWLLKARGGFDYMARMDREVGYDGWINVGYGRGRSPVEYGRRPIRN